MLINYYRRYSQLHEIYIHRRVIGVADTGQRVSSLCLILCKRFRISPKTGTSPCTGKQTESTKTQRIPVIVSRTMSSKIVLRPFHTDYRPIFPYKPKQYGASRRAYSRLDPNSQRGYLSNRS